MNPKSQPIHKLFFSFAVALAIAPCTNVSAQVPDRIKLGNLISLTGPFARAVIGQNVGTKLAVAEINKAGGILGKQVDLIQADDQGDPTVAVNEILRLATQAKVNVLIGPMSSQLTLAVQPTLNQNKIASISTSGSTLLTPEIGNYHFSINPPADAQGRTIARYASQVKAKSVAILGDNGAQTKATVEAMKAALKTSGIKVTGEQEFTVRSNDMTPQLLSLRRGNPDLLVILPNAAQDHATITTNLRDMRWNIKLLGGVGVTFQPGAVKIDPHAFDNMVSVGTKATTYCTGQPMGAGVFAKFRERLKAFAPDDYDRMDHQLAAWTYDGVQILKAGIEATKSVDGPNLTKWIEANVSKVKGLVLGPYQANAKNHFFFDSPDALTMVEHPEATRADGAIKRAGC